MVNKLFVAGLAYSVSDGQLQELFAEIGKVVSAKVITDKYTGQSKGFGFVEMATVEEAKLAMDKLNNASYEGRNIIVKEAKPQEPRERSFDNRNKNFDNKNKKDTNKRNRW
jgi:RNA recognition motif-containing protein